MMFNNHTVARPFGGLHVAELARRVEVTPATIRYYARIGLLDPGREPENGYRRFSSADLHRVVFIRQAQALGLTIGDIKAVFETLDNGEIPCHQVRSLVEQRLVSIRGRIADLQAIAARITRTLESWEQMNDPTPLDGELCPLIERVGAENSLTAEGTRWPAGQREHDHVCHHNRTNDLAQRSVA
jgi:DNA-binding transcriptional MerR regulator